MKRLTYAVLAVELVLWGFAVFQLGAHHCQNAYIQFTDQFWCGRIVVPLLVINGVGPIVIPLTLAFAVILHFKVRASPVTTGLATLCLGIGLLMMIIAALGFSDFTAAVRRFDFRSDYSHFVFFWTITLLIIAIMEAGLSFALLGYFANGRRFISVLGASATAIFGTLTALSFLPQVASPGGMIDAFQLIGPLAIVSVGPASLQLWRIDRLVRMHSAV